MPSNTAHPDKASSADTSEPLVWCVNPWGPSKSLTSKDTAHPLRPVDVVKGLSSRLVKLIVGESKIELLAHEDHLINIPFFKGAFTGRFKEAIEGCIELPDETPSMVENFLLWILCGRDLWDTLAANLADSQERDAVLDQIILADKWCIPALREQACSVFWDLSTKEKAGPDSKAMISAHERLGDIKARLLPIHLMVVSDLHNDESPLEMESLLVLTPASSRFWKDYLSYKQVLGTAAPLTDEDAAESIVCEDADHINDTGALLIRGLLEGIVNLDLFPVGQFNVKELDSEMSQRLVD